MKLGSLFLLGVLVAGLVVMAAPIAHADSAPDPHVVMNEEDDPATCPAGDLCFDATNGAGNPLVLDFFNQSEGFFYSGCNGPTDTVCDTTLTTLFILLVGPALQPGNYDCSGNVFTAPAAPFCQPYFPPAEPYGLELDGAVDILPGEEGTVMVTPEPAVLLLLGLGVAAVMGFRKKFRLSETPVA